MQELQSLLSQRDQFQLKLDEVNVQIQAIEQDRARKDAIEHLKKEGSAIVSHALTKVGGVGYMISIRHTTVPIRIGDRFRVGPGYGNTFTVKEIKTCCEDIMEFEIPVDVGLGQMVITRPNKQINEGDRIIKITL